MENMRGLGSDTYKYCGHGVIMGATNQKGMADIRNERITPDEDPDKEL